ncbi:MAG: aminomethyl-transferring glycine dehydrogenase subunit GcvPA, partial [Candidatus Altiarchaeales archaeon]|nr:aminomethyl-transferring glycine dehydrogenase subunit GcvPA [Candidatus Altiarchaeales archaeon]
MDYLPHDTHLIEEEFRGEKNLFDSIPEDIRLKKELRLGAGLSELQLKAQAKKISEKNNPPHASFLGAGFYRHYVPEVVDYILSRPEFYTAYTPYQPEASQGMLEILFEYQSLVCLLTGCEVSNASLYDGPTALAEACLMACRIKKKKTVYASDTLNPMYLRVLETYARFCGFKVRKYDCKEPLFSEDACAVVFQNPDFFGKIHDADEADLPEDPLKIICVCEATSFGLIDPPPNLDICCGEMQALGNPLNFGGPSLGFLATKQKHVRRMPGRLVGQTKDGQGNPGFVLTYQTREQHIRRAKATSNICTSQSLNAACMVAYLKLLGSKGLERVAWESHQNAKYLRKRITEIPGTNLASSDAFYNEFLIEAGESLPEKAQEKGIELGFRVSRWTPEYPQHLLLCA